MANGPTTKSEHDSYFSETQARQFGRPHDDPEGLHLKYKQENPHHALVATQYFGFSVVEAKIHACLYLLQHPSLATTAGGALVFQGLKAHRLAAELYDYRAYLDERVLGDLSAYALENSYQVEVLEHGNKFRTRFSDPLRENSFDITHTAVSERIYWPSGKHFEQVMRCEGTLVLRGRQHAVSAFHVRDRSWGEKRMEVPLPSPPITWMTGVFDEGFSFCLCGTDDPELDPVWKGHFQLDPRDALKFGWVMIDGEPTIVTSMRKSTTYDRSTCTPQRITVEITDARGRKLNLAGTIIAAAAMVPFPNTQVPICLCRWECNGRVGHGDVQDAQYTDFVRVVHDEESSVDRS